MLKHLSSDHADFVAGASGVIGRALLPRLIANGHVVAGMTRSSAKAPALRKSGAEPIVCDVFNRAALVNAVHGFRPDLILEELTDLPDDRAQLPARALGNARIRVEGTHNLIEAAERADQARTTWTICPCIHVCTLSPLRQQR